MILRVMKWTIALIVLVRAMAGAQSFETQPPFFACGPPATIPNPNYSLVEPHDGETGVEIDRKALILGLDSDSSASYLQSIELVPLQGSVVDVTVPKSPSIKRLETADRESNRLGGIAYAASVPLPFLDITGNRPHPVFGAEYEVHPRSSYRRP